MNIPFIYKYQPKYLSDFYISNDLLDILNLLTKLNNLNILLFGYTSSGKSTLIKAIISNYYNHKINNDDILNINTIKEQGISYYRTNVKNFCQTKCSIKGKKKFLILDDIDNINQQSQQVFRNYIDTYSNNINIIASCNDLQKVIKSIQSRLINIKLNCLDETSIIKIINNICLKENIKINDTEKKFLLSISNNSIITVINYLEKIKLFTYNNNNIDIKIINEICTNISFDNLNTYIKLCKKEDLKNSINILYYFIDKGYSVIDILNILFIYIKTTEILDENEKYNIITLISKYITIFYNLHEDEIELVIFTNNLIKILNT